MKTVTEIRESFWELHPEYKDEYRKTYRQNQYSADIRMAFSAYIDYLKRDEVISEKLALRARL